MKRPEGITRYQWLRYNFYFVLEHFIGYTNFEKIAGKRRDALFVQIDKQLKGSNRGELLELPTVTGEISMEEFNKKYVNNVLPVLFKGAANEWVCTKKWSFDFFKEQYGKSEISLIDNVGVIDRDNPQEFEQTTFADYIDQLRAGSLKYLKFSRIMDEDSSLKNDVDLNWLRKFMSFSSIREQFFMFMGVKNTITPIHNGFAHTIFIQVTGKKRWILWEPNERIFLDPRPERRSYWYSNADPNKEENPSFPLFKYAKRYEVILEPGDVLWFPGLLWHQVENTTDSISIAYKFVDIPSVFKSSRILAPLFFLSTKPNIFIQFFFQQINKTDYIFTKKREELK